MGVGGGLLKCLGACPEDLYCLKSFAFPTTIDQKRLCMAGALKTNLLPPSPSVLLRISLFVAGFVSLVCLLRAADAPAAQTDTLEFTTTGRSALTEADQPAGRQSEYSVSASWLQRLALPFPDWYWGGGLCADVYTFHGANSLGLSRLQDCAAQFSLEYFVAGEAAVSVIVRPGLYFENHPGLSSWDIPVEAVSGVPFTKTFNGVLGLLDARFYRRAVPVVGVVWTPNDQVRLEAVYPEPALVVTFNPQWEARLGGELTGAGFRTDASLGHRGLEYSTYRVGATLTGGLAAHLKLTGGGGYEVERTFDFLHESRRVHAGSAPYVRLNLEFAL